MKMNYISIEGLEGAGKTTAMKAIKDFLEEKKRKYEVVREPGGTPLAESLRDLVKSNRYDEKIDKTTEALIFFAARNQLLINVVMPTLEEGNFVVSDRCYLSSVTYQKCELVELLSKTLVIKPELIVYLDIDPVIGLERARSRGFLDRIEQKDINYFQKVRENYLEEVKVNDNIVLVDGSQKIEEVYESVRKILIEKFN